jgi:hypothetical protein
MGLVGPVDVTHTLSVCLSVPRFAILKVSQCASETEPQGTDVGIGWRTYIDIHKITMHNGSRFEAGPGASGH